LVPDLIVEAPSLANGGLVENADGTLTVSYEIEPEAVWSDGAAVTGTDFTFTHDAIRAPLERFEEGPDPSLPTVSSCGQMSPIAFRSEVADGHARIVPGFPVVRRQAGGVHTGRSGCLFRSLLAYVLPEHAVAGTDVAADWLDRLWPSAGPFVLESFDREGRLITLKRNENYWRIDPETGQALPLVDRIIVGRLREFSERLPDSIEFEFDLPT